MGDSVCKEVHFMGDIVYVRKCTSWVIVYVRKCTSWVI